MGLLDEAIREHLELKRRRGADPSAIAREEREALAPVFPDESADDDGDSADGAPEAVEIEPAAVPADEARPHEEDRLADLSTVGQETAELDMQAVLDGDLDAADSSSPVGPLVDPVPAFPSEETSVEDSLDWEFPGEREDDGVPEDIPGQERLSFE
jgi:hypothetical protein